MTIDQLPGPIVGFRMWRLHRARLWPVRCSARRPWPGGDVRAVCEAWDTDPVAGGHSSPAASGECGCGLYAYHDVDALEYSGVDVWGAVLAWGRVEVHAEGFRSEWQRPIVLCEPPGTPGVRGEELRAAAARHGALLGPADQLEAIAREHGDLIPIDMVPVTPLSLLSSHWAWLVMVPPDPSDGLDLELRELAKASASGSVHARHQLACRAVDLAVNAVLEPVAPGVNTVPRLEGALTALLAAAERWTPADLSTGAEDEQDFRAYAAAWIDHALRVSGPDRGVQPPVTLTYGQVRKFADASNPSLRMAPPSPYPLFPLTEQQLLTLLPKLARYDAAAGDLVDGLWHCLNHRLNDPDSLPRIRNGLARRLYAAGSRAPGVMRTLIYSDRLRHAPRHRQSLLRCIARDPAVHPHLRAQALEQLAEDGSLKATLDFLGHPLSNPWQATSMLTNHGTQGKVKARMMLTGTHLTDAQLCACLGALGSEAAAAARERLDSRPTPARTLLGQCIKALPTAEAITLVIGRVDNGEAVTNTDWWSAITELPSPWQLSIARDLLDRVSEIRPAERIDKLLKARDATRPPTPGERPTALEKLIHDTAMNAPDLNADDRSWFLEEGW